MLLLGHFWITFWVSGSSGSLSVTQTQHWYVHDGKSSSADMIYRYSDIYCDMESYCDMILTKITIDILYLIIRNTEIHGFTA